MRYLLFVLSFLILPFQAWSDTTGTLIVNYNTGPKGERLERVRFRLTDPEGQRTLYPKTRGYVEDTDNHARIVVLENLKRGNYGIEFLVPNRDGLFEAVPKRTVNVVPGKNRKLTQTIKPQYASVTASVEVDTTQKPVISLIDSTGEVIAISAAGKLIAQELIPGNYTLHFQAVDGFETPSAMQLTLAPHQSSPPLLVHYTPTGTIATQSALDLYDRKPESEIILPKTGERIYSYPPSDPGYPDAKMNVDSTLPYAHWAVYNSDGDEVITGQGSEKNVFILPGDNYTVNAETFDDYDLQIYPQNAFSIDEGQMINVEFIYRKTFGYLEVKSDLPSGEMVKILIAPESGDTPLRATMIARNGKIDWKSKALPTGTYRVSFIPPPHYQSIDAETVDIEKNQTVRLLPAFIGARVIKVNSNAAEAVYTLKAQHEEKQWQGKGQSHTFEGLTPGQYTLNFSSKDPKRYLPPVSQKLNIPRYSEKDLELSATYDLAGELTISSNASPFTVRIDGLGSNRTHIEEHIQGPQKTFNLPVGRYRVTFEELQSDHISSNVKPKPVEIEVNTARTEEIFGDYQPVPTGGKTTEAAISSELVIRTNVKQGAFTLKSVDDDEEPVEKNYQGKQVTIPLDASKNYIITFEPVVNYQTPPPIPVTLQEGKKLVITGEYQPMQVLLTVPGGPSIVGDPHKNDPENVMPAQNITLNEFQIGKYEVTNAQFAFWLNDALQKNIILFNEGKVTDKDGKLLCKTMDADPKSQITISRQGGDSPIFQPMPGKAEYPVIFVTWYGADLYASSNNLRLPTEAEWETAAAIAVTVSDSPLNKYIYGFSRDTIDRSWANYKTDDSPLTSEAVKTTPVGFYNGMHMLPLTKEDTKQWTTHLAQSPVGAFDMSGNVWEWVNDWYSAVYYKHMPKSNPQGPKTGDEKVVKGGCFDSTADGVRVAERMGLPPDHCDEFTGFRVAANMADN